MFFNILLVFLGLIIGIGLTFLYFKEPPLQQEESRSPESYYQEGFDAAKKRVLDSNLGSVFITSDDIRSVSGNVTEIKENLISVRVNSLSPFEDPELNERIIVIGPNTKILALVQKSQEVMRAEMEAFAVATSSIGATSLPTPPTPFSLIPTEVSNIQVGNLITITAIENIKDIKEFTASEIQVFENDYAQ
ncbi:MAG: hypothetical protein K9M10_02035 [Candidatus Pacebacteria bacterium]|nr:hypothetical protein [Candidatus Paceibacterota bacterium]MCF7857244.1 hypothetical protein [Candidatus Paceibacterota bacterium]